jgi:hypothetical protein
MRAGARTALALVVALQLVAETALTPYLPELFRDLFGVTDLAVTGGYLTACRTAGLLALPLWGLAARRWPLPRLVVAGLLGSAVFDLGLALAPGVGAFTALSAGAVATGSSLVLAYPALVALLEDTRGGGGGRVSAVVTYTAVFFAASVVATGVGAAVVALPEPRVGLVAFALADLALAALVWRCVPVGARVDTVPSTPAAPGPAPGPARPARARPPLAPVVAVAAVAVLADLGTTVARPFLVELVLAGGGDLAVGAVLFALPAVVALAVLPVAGGTARRLGDRLLPVAAAVAAGGLALQAAVAGSLPALAAGRVVLGVGLGLLAVGLDLRVFAAVGTAGPGFTSVETARSAALLAAPLLATGAASVALALPLLAGGVLLAGAGLLAAATPRARPLRPATTVPPVRLPETLGALDPVR